MYMPKTLGSQSPQSSALDTASALDNICDTIHPVFVCGDFNLPSIDWNTVVVSDSASKENVL